MGRYTDFPTVAGRYIGAVKGRDSKDLENYFITGAEDELDGHAAVRYPVPFTPVPGFIRDLATDMVYCKVAYASDDSKRVQAWVNTRLAMLKDGSVTLTVSGSSIDRSNFAVAGNSYHTSFGPDNEVNWRVDSNWVGDVQGQRGWTVP